MRFEIVTLFPELFDVLRTGLLGKAQDSGTIHVHATMCTRSRRVSSRPTDTEPSTTLLMAAAAAWC